jgi:hypothetical protein
MTSIGKAGKFIMQYVPERFTLLIKNRKGRTQVQIQCPFRIFKKLKTIPVGTFYGIIGKMPVRTVETQPVYRQEPHPVS